MAKHRYSRAHGVKKGGSGNYTSATTYGEYVNGSGDAQFARVFSQTGANAANQSNVLVGEQGQWRTQPGVPTANSLALVQRAGKRSRSRSQGRGRSQARSRSQSRGRSRTQGRSRAGGFWGSVVNQAIVPFSLLAMQQSYRKKGGRKTRKMGRR